MGARRPRERAVAAKLKDLSPAFVEVLHDRSVRRPDGRLSKANIDHIVIPASGVWVVDAKTHQGRLEVRRAGGLFRAATSVRARPPTRGKHPSVISQRADAGPLVPGAGMSCVTALARGFGDVAGYSPSVMSVTRSASSALEGRAARRSAGRVRSVV